MPPEPIEVLLVEDNPGDVRLTREGLAEAKVGNRLHVVEDGVEAMAFLRRQDPYGDVPRPDLILLDLNLPRRDGKEVLEELKEDADLCSIPVVVLTSSEAEKDILRAYRLHANSYVCKPVGFSEFMEAVRAIEHFWLMVVKLPPNR